MTLLRELTIVWSLNLHRCADMCLNVLIVNFIELSNIGMIKV